MTNKQAAQAARKIPFDPEQALPSDVGVGLRRIVLKQLRSKLYPPGTMHDSRERSILCDI